jgi:catechol 2,3-dioxygenase-like lactoylglutathione lyase family enzyme
VSDISNLPPLQGIHHLKLAVTDLQRSLSFYETLFGAKRIPQADHKHESDGSPYAFILDVPNLGAKLELRLNPEQARKHFHFDPITIAVQDKAALEHWESYLDEKKLPHSPILVAIQAWLIVVEDPDGNRIRLYTLETHSRDLKPDEGDRWLND